MLGRRLSTALLGPVIALWANGPCLAQSLLNVALLPELRIGAVVADTLPPTRVVIETAQKDFRLHLDKGDSIRIDLESDDFDPEVVVLLDGKVLARDDDGAPNLNARLRFTAPAGGDYVLRVVWVDDREGREPTLAEPGKFRIVVVADAAVAPLPTFALALGTPTSGLLVGTSPTANIYRFSAEAGDRIVVDLKAGGAPTGLPPTLRVRRPDSSEFLPALSSRPAADQRRIGVRLPATGTYELVVAKTTSRDQAYVLTATTSHVDPPTPRSLRVGESTGGRFSFRDPETSGDAGEERGLLVQTWRLAGPARRTIRVEICGPDGAPKMQVTGATALGERRLLTAGRATPDDKCAGVDLPFARDEEVRILASPPSFAAGDYTLTARVAVPAAARPAP